MLTLLLATAITIPLQGCVSIASLTGPLTWSANAHLVNGQFSTPLDPTNPCHPTTDQVEDLFTTVERTNFTSYTLDPFSLELHCKEYQLDLQEPGLQDTMVSLVLYGDGVGCPGVVTYPYPPVCDLPWCLIPPLIPPCGLDCEPPPFCVVGCAPPPVVPVPEPTTLLLLVIGLAMLIHRFR